LSSRHRDTSFKDVRSPTALSDTASLRGRTGRRRRTVRNPLRSDRFLPLSWFACHLNAGILKLRVLSSAVSLPSDGAYPRPEGRGIAPAHRISGEPNGGDCDVEPAAESPPLRDVRANGVSAVHGTERSGIPAFFIDVFRGVVRARLEPDDKKGRRARWDSHSMARLTAFVSRSSNPLAASLLACETFPLVTSRVRRR